MEDYQLNSVNNDKHVRTSLVYRRCENVFNKMKLQGIKEINKYDLMLLIKKYIAGSPQTVKNYVRHFLDFKFLRQHPFKSSFLVNHENNIFSSGNERTQKIQENVQLSPHLRTSRTLKQTTKIFQERDSEQSKTQVHPTGDEKKKTCSFKGYHSIWQDFKEAVWADGFPDICYVEHIFHRAYLSASRDTLGVIHMPFRLGNTVFNITINAPYIVQRPRRRIVKREIIEEDF